MTPELTLAVLRSLAKDDSLRPLQALLDLVHMLARTHESMDNYDWEVVATAGALLWRTEMRSIEAQAEFEMLMQRLRK
ncbi:hypothetical protein [Paraburkholderia ferrariae]|uniref:hypothetical protein n=1 Tax=Paraburkholderia ferrariae TaxID=386056 RepID=UPI0004898FD3|nr:hypothetical protein [Paraburkholderia ferrariae]